MSCVRLGKGAWKAQHRVWRRQYYPGGYDSGKTSGCFWSGCICCVSAWRSAISGRGFSKLFGKWVPFQAHGVLHVWALAAEALPPANRCICVWEPGSVLSDAICGKPFEGRRDSGLVGISSHFAKGHHDERPIHTKPSRCGGEYCWSKAISAAIPETDWRQNDGDSLVVKFSIVGVLLRQMKALIAALLFRRKGWTVICTTITLLAWNSGYFIFFWKFVSVIITFSVWYMLVRSGSGAVAWKFLGTHQYCST